MKELIGQRVRFRILVLGGVAIAGEGVVTAVHFEYLKVMERCVHQEHITHVESKLAPDGWAEVGKG